jgi:phospholipid/cholesterol/gamma-HCH transport system substrate-binding protein
LKISREVKIAVVFIIALASFFWGFNFLKGRDVFKKQRIFYAVYDQVNGLVEANPVVVNGFKVGQIRSIYFHPDKSGRIMVEFVVINNDISIPKNSVARLFSSDIMGSRAIEIQLGHSRTEAKSGDTLQTVVGTTLGEEVSIQMKPVKTKFEQVMSSIDSVLVIIQSVFNENTRQNLLLSFESIKKTIMNLEHTTFNIDTLVTVQKSRLSNIISNVDAIAANIKKNDDKIANIINNFSNITDSIAKINFTKIISKADKTLSDVNNIIDKVNRGEGSLGMLVNNDTLYKNLESSSLQLNQLVEDIKLNPQRYLHFSVFPASRKKNQYKPPSPGSK